MLAFGNDLRVVLIYLASRLQTLRWVTKNHLTPCPVWAQEILDIDASLANRLGIWQMKWEMEDLAFRVLSPATYKEIAGLLDSRRVEREQFIRDVIARLKQELQPRILRLMCKEDLNTSTVSGKDAGQVVRVCQPI